jgi:CHAT domain-containing protein
LYKDLIAPLASLIARDEVVAIEPHGPLWLVPFAALEDESGSPLVGRWPIVYAPSAAVLDQIRREPAFDRSKDIKALIVGNPLTAGVALVGADGVRNIENFAPLLGAESEAQTLSGLVPRGKQKLLIGRAATLNEVTFAAPSHTLIHLASHALANGEKPLESFVLLAAGSGDNGRLTAQRVLNLTLAVDLVTLSACETGLGYLSGDGIIGLSRAFLAAGARSILVSQWRVSDTGTPALMKAFYEQYTGSTVDKARALQRAMMRTRSTPGLGHPAFWAPFVLIGSEL